jgi:hypothetical protein
MGYVKRIVCLANSYKPPNGRCVAGREVLADGYGGWIRPVSARPTAEVSFAEYRYEDNGIPKLLDIVDIPILAAAPSHHQTENHVIDTGLRWVRGGELPWSDLEQLREQPETLWVNRDHTNAGHYDCMSQEEAATVDNSLLLIRPDNFRIQVGTNYWTRKKYYRGKFEYNGSHHSLSITDPAVRDAFAGKQEGDYPLNDAYLCVSLTEPYKEDGRCHKLVAAVLSNKPF